MASSARAPTRTAKPVPRAEGVTAVARSLAILDAFGTADAQLALAEIAHAVGFSSQAHFTQVFRQLVGSTPARTRASRVSPRAG